MEWSLYQPIKVAIILPTKGVKYPNQVNNFNNIHTVEESKVSIIEIQ